MVEQGSTDAAQDLVSMLATAALQDIENLTDLLVSALRPPGAAAQLYDLRLSLQRCAELALVSLRDHKTPQGAELAPLTILGAQAAREGVSWPMIVRATARARDVVYRALLTQQGNAGWKRRGAVAAFDAAALLSTSIESCAREFTAALAIGVERSVGEQLSLTARRTMDLVTSILHGRWHSEADLRRHGHQAERPLQTLFCLGLLVPATKYDQHSLFEGCVSVTAGLQAVLLGPASWTPQAHVPIVVTASTPAELDQVVMVIHERAGRRDIVAALSEPTHDLGSLRDLYRSGAAHLEFAPAATSGPGIVTLRRLEVFAVIAGSPTVVDLLRFVNRVLGRLQADAKADQLFELLDAYYDSCGSSPELAAKINFHENTVRQWLRRIGTLTGLDLNRVDDSHELVTAVRVRRLLKTQLHRLEEFPDCVKDDAASLSPTGSGECC